MLVSCILKKGIAYIPTAAKTEAGFHMIGEPVAVVPAADSYALQRALRDAMTRGNAVIPTPKRDAFPRSVLPKYAGEKSWSAFMRGASEWDIYEKDGNYQITPWMKDPEGSQSWVPDSAHKIVFPPNTVLDEVIDRMIAILQNAA
jgi:hypothetical protein